MQSSLLSPAESHAFQSFLSTMDYPDETLTASEWAVYNSGAPIYGALDDILDDSGGGGATDPAQREALAKATKDLMALDPDGWSGGGAMMEGGGSPQVHDARGQYGLQHQQHQQDQQRFAQRQQSMQHLQQQQQHRQHSFSSGADLFPFLHNKVSSSHELRYPMQRHLQHPLLGPSPMAANSDHASPTSPQSPFGFQQQQQQQQQHNAHAMVQPQRHLQQLHQVHIPTHPEQHQRPQQQQQQRGPSPSSNSTARSTKRPPSVSRSTRPGESNITASTSTSSGRSNGTPNGTHAASAPSTKRQRASTLPSTTPNAGAQQGPTGTATKQALLSPSQKKANHIQSEQKRRANIRRGYEALCETVPALRAAIREEEEAERLAALAGGGRGGAQRKKRGAKKGARDGEERDAKERLDGRAGPRSENVVLSKTIEHIQALIADRSALLARLYRARSSLPPGHPALSALMPDPPWEREWKGGSGRLDGDDMDGEGGSEGEMDEGEDEGE